MNNTIVITRKVYDKVIAGWGQKQGTPLMDSTTTIIEPDGTKTIIPYNQKELDSKVPLLP